MRRIENEATGGTFGDKLRLSVVRKLKRTALGAYINLFWTSDRNLRDRWLIGGGTDVGLHAFDIDRHCFCRREHDCAACELGECAAGDGVQFQSALARQIELR